MQLHELKPTTVRKTAKRIGRGGKRGKTSGRGGKGQTARAGNSMRPEMRDFIKKLPKLRGHGVNRAATVNEERVRAFALNVSALEAAFKAGDTVSPKILVAAGVVETVRKKAPKVKILATGELTKALTIEGCEVSAAAKAKIEKAGGKVL
ncbi:MAG: uL15 family ribosomal protein [Candidatus Pacebacteria bacterium]|jgi:large subunit ribosomal protein L15|nr:uL15 family ribosomal protein [Candidatus Paceibacterota bacterium]